MIQWNRLSCVKISNFNIPVIYKVPVYGKSSDLLKAWLQTDATYQNLETHVNLPRYTELLLQGFWLVDEGIPCLGDISVLEVCKLLLWREIIYVWFDHYDTYTNMPPIHNNKHNVIHMVHYDSLKMLCYYIFI
jgi:hypothetical protein